MENILGIAFILFFLYLLVKFARFFVIVGLLLIVGYVYKHSQVSSANVKPLAKIEERIEK